MPSLVPSSEDVRIYECCVLYPYPFGQKEESDLLKEVEGLFADAGAREVSKDKWGQRGLAYPIKGFTEGNFIIYYYEMDPAKLKELDQALRITKGVLRHMFVKPPKGYQVLKYSELYVQWLKERENVDQRRKREKEEQVQEQVARKAKRQAKMQTERKKAEPTPGVQGEQLQEKLDKLISDDSLDL